MTVRRTVTATLAALAVGGVLLAPAGAASAQPPADRTPGPVPGMARMHQLMTEQNPGMARMHQLMTDGPR